MRYQNESNPIMVDQGNDSTFDRAVRDIAGDRLIPTVYRYGSNRPVSAEDHLAEASFRLLWYRERLPHARRLNTPGGREEVRRILAWIPIWEVRLAAARHLTGQ